jgi:F0F1-type ATP synthase delta subunit
MKAKKYAKVILSLGESKLEQVLAHLHTKGLIGLLPTILKEMKLEIRREEKFKRVIVTSSRLLSNNQIEILRNQYADFLPAQAEIEQIIDLTQIGGYKIENNNRIIDATYKRALFDLYQKVKTT